MTVADNTSVTERAVRQHMQGEHMGPFPFSHCPVCEVEHPRGALAQERGAREQIVYRCGCGHLINPDEEHPYGDPRTHVVVHWTGEPRACGPGAPVPAAEVFRALNRGGER